VFVVGPCRKLGGCTRWKTCLFPRHKDSKIILFCKHHTCGGGCKYRHLRPILLFNMNMMLESWRGFRSYKFTATTIFYYG
jgi:hypothetical protein